MRCPMCGSEQTKCINTRPRGEIRYRRYTCLNCGRRFTTWEIYASVIEEILKVEKALNKMLKYVKPKRLRNGKVQENRKGETP